MPKSFAMVKLTPDLVLGAAQYLNPCRDRELDLRGECLTWVPSTSEKELDRKALYNHTRNILGYKIPLIENLGTTLDQFDTIDFSDNEIRKVDNIPFLPRIKTLLFNNNRIW